MIMKIDEINIRYSPPISQIDDKVGSFIYGIPHKIFCCERVIANIL